MDVFSTTANNQNKYLSASVARSDQSDLLTSDFKAAPFWWDSAPLVDRTAIEVPEKCDVAIVGSGYTGLCAAIELASHGRQCVVFDAEEIGAGLSLIHI